MKKSFLFVGMLTAALSMSLTSCHDSDVEGVYVNTEAEMGTSYIISGTVQDGEGNALSNVKVSGLAGVSTVGSTFSQNVASGTYNLTFSKDGYKSYTVSVTLASATTENPTVTATVAAVLPKMEAVTVAADVDYTTTTTVAENQVSVSLPSTGTEQSNVSVAVYTPAAAEVVSTPVAVKDETVADASPLAVTVENYTVGETTPTLSIPVAGATTEYVLLSCVNGNTVIDNVPFENGAYNVELPHFSTWTFNLGALTKTVTVGNEVETAFASASNSSSVTKTVNLKVQASEGYTLSMNSSLPAGMQALIKAAIRNIEGSEGVKSVTKTIPVSISGSTKATYTFANTTATITYKVGLSGNKTQLVTVTRYTGLKLKSEKLEVIGHSGGSGK